MRLNDCFVTTLAFLTHFQSKPAGDISSVRAQLDELLTAATATAQDMGKVTSEVQDALFAVVALADEIMLSAPWAAATEWPRYLLQKRYFDVSNAGDAFFFKLEQLSPQSEAREVYFFCLGMGFAGRYGYDRNAKALADVKQTSLALLQRDAHAANQGTGLTPDMDKFMFPEGYSSPSNIETAAGASKPGRWGFRFSALTINMTLIPIGVLCILYAAYHVIIWQTTASLLLQVK